MERAGLPFAPIRKPEDLYDDPHLRATGGLADVRLPDGDKAGETVKTTLLPFTMAGSRLGVRLDPPRLGEHTRALLSSLGLTPDDDRCALPAACGGLTDYDNDWRNMMSRISLALARRAFMAAAVIGGMALCASSLAQVGEKAVRIVLPNATGSGVDAITRTAQPALAKALGKPVVIENQPGAGGIVGVQTLTRAAPDGMTLSVVSNNVVIFPSVYKTLPFELPADITPIAIVGFTPVVLVVNPKVPAANSKELIALIKSQPGKINYGSSGNGTILHLACEVFLDEAGVKATHVPYKGVGPMLTDLLGGQVDFATAALPSVQRTCRPARCGRSAWPPPSACRRHRTSRRSSSRVCRAMSSKRGSR